MFAALALLFLVVPFLELFVLLQVGQAIGTLPTVGVVVVVSVLGAWLVKREGLGVVRRVLAQARAGGMPAQELVDGFLIVFAGVLLLTPGFLTDAVGLLLLLPPVRAVVRAAGAQRLSRRAAQRLQRW